MHLTALTVASNDPQASVGLIKCLDNLRKMEMVWPSATRAWELLHGAKDDLQDQEAVFSSVSRPNKRVAEDGFKASSALLERPQGLPQKNGGSAPFTTHQPPPQPGFGTLENANEDESPLAFFTSYDRWSSDSSLGFHSGLSTSVLPQQYSTGFVDEGFAQAGAHRQTPMVNVDQAGSNGRYQQFWNDYSAVGQPSSMLSSMYGLPMTPQGSVQQQRSAQDEQQLHQQPMFMNDQFNLFGSLPPS